LSAQAAERLFFNIIEETNKQNKSAGRLTSTSVANLPANRPLNRWHNVLPADGSRVVLNPPFKGTDYINANHVVIPDAKRAYILTQGPLPGTVGHFWTMVWQQKSEAIIMLCKTVEGECVKCAHYWPQNSSRIMGTSAEPLKFRENGGLEVRLLEEEAASADTRIRVLELTAGKESGGGPVTKRIVTQYHFQTWPDFGVPATPDTFLSFLRLVSRQHPSTSANPNVVHCSAGIGRSGTFCLVDSCLQKMRLSGKPMNQEEVLSLLLKMRRQRDGQVQTPDQLRFAFAAISDAMSGIDFEQDQPSTIPKPANLIKVNSDSEQLSKSEVDNGKGADSPLADDESADDCVSNGGAVVAEDEEEEKGEGEERPADDAESVGQTNGVSAELGAAGKPTGVTTSLSNTALSRKRSTDIASATGSESLAQEVAARVAAAAAASDREDDEDVDEAKSNSNAAAATSSGCSENLAKRKRDC